jgi:hypothetical protein
MSHGKKEKRHKPIHVNRKVKFQKNKIIKKDGG